MCAKIMLAECNRTCSYCRGVASLLQRYKIPLCCLCTLLLIFLLIIPKATDNGKNCIFVSN